MHQTHKAIGILGGTFDPIHFGHLRMSLELCESLDLSKVHIIPCYRPVHRKTPVATPEQRLAMVQHAVANEPALVADPREIHRKAPSYSIETVKEMHKEFPDTPLCLMLGIDSFLGFSSWLHWEEILKYAHLIVAHRPQFQLPASGLISELLKERAQTEISYIHENISGGILVRPITALDISATDIRRQISMGKNPRYLLPDSVYDYVKQQGIYSIGPIQHD